ncbi:MAG: hypothetical protein SNJ71_01850 [Bacteroidales bacterium]
MQLSVGDYGTKIVLTILDQNKNPVIINDPVRIDFKRPNHTTFSRNAQILNDGTDGKVFYITQPGDIDMPGEWILQACITDNSSYRFYSSCEILQVNKILIPNLI